MNKKEPLEWLEYDIFSPFSSLKQATFSRKGGESLHPFSSLNIGRAVGDDVKQVLANRELIRKSLNVDSLFFGSQVHGTDWLEVTKDNVTEQHSVDILCTKEKGIGLGIGHADCQAVLFYDPKQGVIGAVHAGWKGLMQQILSKTVDVFKEHYHSNPGDLLVAISPSLGPTFSEFVNYKKEINEEYWDFQIKPNYFDLWEISRVQLTKSGILDRNMEISRICTYSNPQDYFSYRRDKITGRNATVIALV